LRGARRLPVATDKEDGVQRPRTRYARSTTNDGAPVSIAWQQFGGGPHDLVLVNGFVSHVEAEWDDPATARLLESLAGFARVTTFDKRGVGLSDRNVAPPTLEERVDDLLAVMDAAQIDSATLVGFSEGAPLAILFAAAHPDRVESLVLFGGMARTTEADGYPFAPPREALLEAATELLLPHWDEPVLAEVFAPSIMNDPEAIEIWQRYQQVAASPSMILQLYAMAMDFDVRQLLPTIAVATLVLHRRGDRAVSVQGARWMAEQIPGCRYVELDGTDHTPSHGDQAPVIAEIERFVTGTVRETEPERALMTVLFTDIVGSSQRASALGDAAWAALLARHDELMQQVVDTHRGEIRKHTGDGLLATFDGPGRAARAGLAMRNAARSIGLELRIGLHCGEVALRADDLAGIAVHVAARVQQQAGDGDVLVTSTVVDLVSGSGLVFDDLGLHDLKGIDRPWRLYRVSDE